MKQNQYLEALRLALPRIRRAIHAELGMRPPETVEEWREALGKRDTKSIEQFVRYWMESNG